MSNAHANRHGHVPGCTMCEKRVRPFPDGHHSPKRAVRKGKVVLKTPKMPTAPGQKGK